MQTLTIKNHTPEKLELLQKLAKEMGIELDLTENNAEIRISTNKNKGKSRWDVIKQYQGAIIINDLEAVLK